MYILENFNPFHLWKFLFLKRSFPSIYFNCLANIVLIFKITMVFSACAQLFYLKWMEEYQPLSNLRCFWSYRQWHLGKYICYISVFIFPMGFWGFLVWWIWLYVDIFMIFFFHFFLFHFFVISPNTNSENSK